MDYNKLFNKLPSDVKNKLTSYLTGFVLATSKVEKDSITQMQDNSSGIRHVEQNNSVALLKSLLRGESNEMTQKFAQHHYEVLRKADEIERTYDREDWINLGNKYGSNIFDKSNDNLSNEEKDFLNKLEDYVNNENSKIDKSVTIDGDKPYFFGDDENLNSSGFDESFETKRFKTPKEIINRSKTNTVGAMTDGYELVYNIKNYNDNPSLTEVFSQTEKQNYFEVIYLTDDVLYTYEDETKHLQIKKDANDNYIAEFYLSTFSDGIKRGIEKQIDEISFYNIYGEKQIFKVNHFIKHEYAMGWNIVVFSISKLMSLPNKTGVLNF